MNIQERIPTFPAHSTSGNDQELLFTETLLSRHESIVYLIFKRAFDVIVSLIALILLMPFFLVLACLIIIDDPKGSPVYKQERVGKNGRVFTFYKFRTMYVDAESHLPDVLELNEMNGHAFKIKNDPRITRLGKHIRKFSIDELPQFLNVLKGDMSLVGPRPPLPREVMQYNDYEMLRLSVKPGLTCYWQTCPNRNDISFEEWVSLDIQYIRDRNVCVDLRLLFKTVVVMFTGEGE
ncbi:MAG: sugar transferase [Eubacteriaceae bacterium]|jgi:lipopolysaccharide/colanic/teichoic acid biosynthesis glycosyltransferase